MKPIIGLTSQYNQLVDKKMIEINSTYIDAVEKAGGDAYCYPYIKKFRRYRNVY